MPAAPPVRRAWQAQAAVVRQVPVSVPERAQLAPAFPAAVPVSAAQGAAGSASVARVSEVSAWAAPASAARAALARPASASAAGSRASAARSAAAASPVRQKRRAQSARHAARGQGRARTAFASWENVGFVTARVSAGRAHPACRTGRCLFVAGSGQHAGCRAHR